jgi:hypothetical protein
MGRSATATRRSRKTEVDTTACLIDGCGHPRAEHSLDGHTCFHDGAEDGSAAQLTCPCRGFANTEDGVDRVINGEPRNQDVLPDTGPVTAEDIQRNKNGTLNQRALEAAIETIGDGSEDAGEPDTSHPAE